MKLKKEMNELAEYCGKSCVCDEVDGKVSRTLKPQTFRDGLYLVLLSKVIDFLSSQDNQGCSTV